MVNTGQEVIQCMELQKGQINMNSGTVDRGTHIIHCVDDASISLGWTDGTTDDVSMLGGDDYAVRGATVEVVSGLVHIDTI